MNREDLRVGDRVEAVGPPIYEGAPEPGEQGTIVSLHAMDDVISWDVTGTTTWNVEDGSIRLLPGAPRGLGGSVETGEASRPSIAGYLVVLLGVAGWVVSSFLPLYRIADLQNARINLYRQISFGPIGIRVGAFLYLFGGIAAIGAISIVGVLLIQKRNGAVLAGAVLAWFLVSTGMLITLFSAATQFNTPRSSLAYGYWSLWASVVCVVVGTVMVLMSARGEDTEARGGTAQETVIEEPGF